MTVTPGTFLGLLPELVAFGFTVIVLLVGVFSPASKGITAGLAALGAAATFAAAAVLFAAGFSGSFFGGGFVVDNFALYFKLVVAGSALFAILAASRWSARTSD